jgi:hypothetical protein
MSASRSTMASIRPRKTPAPSWHRPGSRWIWASNRANDLGLEQGERLRLGVANGDEPLAGEHEGDRLVLGVLRAGVVVGEHQRGHVGRAVGLVEPAGQLDLGHVLAGRNADAQACLDRLLLLAGRIDQLDPHDVVGHGEGLGGDDLVGGGAAAPDSQHRWPLRAAFMPRGRAGSNGRRPSRARLRRR